MDVKISKSIFFKVIALLLCIYIGITPFFQPKKVQADTLGKIKAYSHIITTVLYGLRTVGFISDTTLTPENLTNIYNKADEYLHQNFGTELEYAEALRQVDQLGLDIASGQIFVPGNYSGKLWYSFLNAVVDVVWPTSMTDDQLAAQPDHYVFMGYTGDIAVFISYAASQFNGFPVFTLIDTTDDRHYYNMSNLKDDYADIKAYAYNISRNRWYNGYGGTDSTPAIYSKPSAGYTAPYGYKTLFLNKDNYLDMVLNGQNTQKVPNITAKTANKVKLPTRLPQTVINNINNYIDGSSENLIVNPAPDELPTLPDNYNPATDDPPDLPGYEDVTPDQEPTPTPTPTPEPTPEPTPTPPDYDGSSWIKPIGDFFAGLLSFLKDALIPTQTVDFSPLQNMGADVSGKFPFSLPGDIGKLFGVLNAEPICPHFEMDFDLSKVGIPGEPIHWDLNVEQWDNGAAVVKTALYIAFLIGLVFITKQFMQN